MSLRSEPKKHLLYEDRAEREEMKEMDTIRRQPPRSQKDTTHSMVSSGAWNNNINNTNSSSNRERPPPPSRSWPLLPLLAVVLCVGFFGARMWPPSKYMNLADPFKTWDPHDKAWKRSQLQDNRKIFEGLQPEVSIDETLRPREVIVEEKNDDMQAGEEKDDMQVGEEKDDFQENNERVVIPEANPKDDIHIFVCTDEADLRPLAVLINSSMVNALHPERLYYHLVMPSTQKDAARRLKHLLPNARVEMASKFIDIHEVEEHITFRNDSGARKELVSPYNFLPFYLPRTYSEIERFIYLDSDIVVKGNLEDLHNVDLEGHSVAAIEDCSQRFQVYFDFDQLNEIQNRSGPNRAPWLPELPFDRRACVFNRGVLVIDTKKWQDDNITEAIVWWMDEFRKANKTLYKAGMSQPPFLLALYGKHKALDETWNVRGLGRPNLSDLERAYFKKMFNMTYNRTPFISPFADEAHILHFNGKYKPWKGKRKRGPNEDIISLCGSREKGQECANLWWEYLSPEANDFLKKKPLSKGIL